MAAGDYDRDGWPDLFVGAIEGSSIALYHNRGDGHFDDVTASCGLHAFTNTFSASAGDFDGDGRLALFLSQWQSLPGECHLWRNLDGNGRTDLLVTSDFGTSRVYLQQLDGLFHDVTGPEITDENGMGAAVGDDDGDGDLDWFVSSIWDPDGVAEGGWGMSGNRLYRNRGNGTFEDATDAAGLRHGYWGWGSTFGDFDLDGRLDLFHVNGWPRGAPEFHADPSRLFLANGDGSFSESSAATALADSGQGRGVVAFDYDRDGDLDLFVANNGDAPALWRNDASSGNWLEVTLVEQPPNPAGIGARIYAIAGGITQLRLIQAGTNFESQNPAEAHFGLGTAMLVDTLRVVWPDGSVTTRTHVAAGQRAVLAVPGSTAPDPVLGARPNPFRDGMDMVVAAIPGIARSILVFDVRGRAIRTLPVSPGQRWIHWDGADDRGHPAPDGIYWLRPAHSTAKATRVVRLR